MNNPTLTEFCFGMIGRADIEGSKSNVAMNAWLPQASYPCTRVSIVVSTRFVAISLPVVTFLAPLASNFEGLKDR